MKTFVISLVLLFATTIGFSQNNPDCPTHAKKYTKELGLTFPLKTDAMKNYIAASNIDAAPLTSGIGSGLQLGMHRIINDKATLGLIVGSNFFFTFGDTKSQIYQLGTYLTGRLYFGETWRNGIFTEIGAGPEFSAASISDGDFKFQGNFATRLGIGYNYQFNKDVTLGISAIVAPSLTTDNYLDNARVVVNMLW